MISDEQLIQAYIEGKEEALRALIDRYLTPVYNFVYRYVKSEGDAEDITQDVFFAVWKNINKFDQQKKFSTWIFTIAKNTSLNWIKKKKPALFSEFESENNENPFLDLIKDPAPLPDELFARAETKQKLREILAKLAPMYRTVLHLRYNEQYSFREIAEYLKEPIDTVKSRHRRALIQLKQSVTSPRYF